MLKSDTLKNGTLLMFLTLRYGIVGFDQLCKNSVILCFFHIDKKLLVYRNYCSLVDSVNNYSSL